MKHIINVVTLLLVTILYSCDVQEQKSEVEQPDVLTEVSTAMDSMVNAWNDGRLEDAFAVYWNSSELLWINRGGISKGYQPVLDGYKQDFADPGKMGTYSYELLHEDKISDSAAFTTIKWQIKFDEENGFGGVSSMLWKKIGGRWVITKEHAS